MAPLPTIDDFRNAEDAIAAASKSEMRGDWKDATQLYHGIAERWPEHQQYVNECVKAIRVKQELSHLSHDASPTMTVGEWLGTLLILSIPVINIIMCLYWTFSTSGNVNRKTYCQALLIWFLIVFVIAIAIEIAA